MSFDNLRARRSSNISNMLNAVENQGAPGGQKKESYKDERIWKPTVDASGNGYAVIRSCQS